MIFRISFLMLLMVVVTRAGQLGLLSTDFIYETAPFPECHASSLVETKAGTLIVTWFGGTEEKSPDVGVWMSRQEAGKWSVPVEVANGLQPDGKRYPLWNPVLFQPATGPLMLFYKEGPSPDTWWGLLRTSLDDGRTWSAAQRLPKEIYGPIKNKPVQLPNGDILSGTSTEHDGWRVHFERSSDGGKTWIATGPMNDGKAISAIQPSILFTGGETLAAVGRSRQGRIWKMSSPDAGKTWSEMTLTDLPNPNSGTDALTLKDGRHLLVYNNTIKGRSPLNVAIGTDLNTWKPVLILEDEPGKEFSYPACIQTRDGKVHITWTWNRKRVRHAVVDPGALLAK